jgi:holo-[acyl-carrier protein] synthase
VILVRLYDLRIVRLRVGIDLVDIVEVQRSISRHGERYLTRIYTPAELHECAADAPRLAAHFAAKEATMKALARGEEGFPWRAVALARGADGSPALKLSGAAADLAEQRGVTELSVSLTHDRGLAGAVVLARLDP